jgi:N-carbamoylputrescine amidase
MGCRVIVFPELAFRPFFPQRKRDPSQPVSAESVPGPTTDLFAKLARELEVVLILNLYEQAGERYFDSSPVIDTDGTLLGVTRMVHIIQAPCFYERDYYSPGDRGAPVYSTKAGRIGVAICYDRHFPEYMRALALNGAELVAVPQAGAVGEWPEGLFEAELQVASLQNGYFCALSNRVGREPCLTFAGESFVTDPRGQVIARAPHLEDHLLVADLDLNLLEKSPAHQHFLQDRRPDVYSLDRRR